MKQIEEYVRQRIFGIQEIYISEDLKWCIVLQNPYPYYMWLGDSDAVDKNMEKYFNCNFFIATDKSTYKYLINESTRKR
jgi:hypothetical protein